MIIKKQKLDIALANTNSTIKAVALQARLSNPTLTKIRQGKEVLPRTVGKLAQALGVEVEYLIKEE